MSGHSATEHRVVVLISALCLLAHCSDPGPRLPRPREYVPAEARRKIPVVHEFLRFFPTSGEHVVRMTFQPDGTHDGVYYIRNVVLHDRYNIGMFIRVTLDPERRMITAHDEPIFMVREYLEETGGYPIFRDLLRFSRPEWDQIVKASGDFSAIGLDMIEDAPIAGIGVMPPGLTFTRGALPPLRYLPKREPLAVDHHEGVVERHQRYLYERAEAGERSWEFLWLVRTIDRIRHDEAVSMATLQSYIGPPDFVRDLGDSRKSFVYSYTQPDSVLTQTGGEPWVVYVGVEEGIVYHIGYNHARVNDHSKYQPYETPTATESGTD